MLPRPLRRFLLCAPLIGLLLANQADALAAPQGDQPDCASAPWLEGPGPHTVTLGGAQAAPLGAWFRWTAEHGGLHSVELCGEPIVSWSVTLLESCAGPVLAQLAFNCQYENNRVLFAAQAGHTYAIHVASPVAPARGAFTVQPFAPCANDECADATPIRGYGEFLFDQTFATSTPTAATSCWSMPNDVWFAWTAPFDRHTTLTVREAFSHIAVYSACGANELDCDLFYSGDGYSRAALSARSGVTYWIRVGSMDTSDRLVGLLSIQGEGPVFDPARQHAYGFVREALPWWEAQAYAESLRCNGFPGHLLTLQGAAETHFVRSHWQPPFAWFGLYQDRDDPAFAEPAGGWKWITGEPLEFTDWLPPRRPDESQRAGGREDFGSLSLDGDWSSGLWEDSQDGLAPFLVEWEQAPRGQPFCEAQPSASTGLPVELVGQHSRAAASGLRLEASQGPAGQFAYFMVGTHADEVGRVIDRGRLCLSSAAGHGLGFYDATGTEQGSLGRFDAFGNLVNLCGTSTAGTGFDVPLSVPLDRRATIVMGTTWYFQLWYRDEAGSANFSNGLRVEF